MNILDPLKMVEYGAIFDLRGSLYHQAMVSFPKARNAEFSAVFSKVPLVGGELIVDVPSGGGYLEAFLKRVKPNSIFSVQNLEFASGFGSAPFVVSPGSSWPIAPKSVDRVICLAASHHLQDLSPLFLNIKEVLKPGGFFHLADISPESGVQKFLESFVHCYTPGGHRGLYRDFFSEAFPSFFEVLDISRRPCPWSFKNIDNMLEFCGGLFGLQEYSYDELELALRNCIGVTAESDGVKLAWELVYIDMRLK